jgi:uncharacterized protein (TIGR00290 family)
MLALHELLSSHRFRVVALLTTMTRDYDRVSMHGVRRALLEEQAAALGLPLRTVELSGSSSNEEYQERMRHALEEFRSRDVHAVAHGDIFLEDVRRYREQMLDSVGMRGLFPIWGRGSAELAHHFLGLGYRAVATCVDSQALDTGFAGREYDTRFLEDLPAGVDPCGENGEFHTFVYDGPLFRAPVPFVRGEVVLRDGRFCYCDLLAGGADSRDQMAIAFTPEMNTP